MSKALHIAKRTLACLLAVLFAAAAGFIVPKPAEAASAGGKKVDLVFVIDSTGSMGDEINNVKSCISAFARTLESWGLRMRIGIVEYRDIEEDGMSSTIVHELNHSVWLNSADDMVDMLSGIEVGGGGDTPETPIDAIGYLVDGSTMRWSSDAYKFAVLLTDAGYKTNNRHGIADMSAAAERLLDYGVNTSVIIPSDLYSTYAVLADTTGGITANIYSDFDTVLEDLANSILGLTNRSKKAIYILPGYLGSELFDGADGTSGGTRLWFPDNIMDLDTVFGQENLQKFYQDENSSGTRLHVDYERDDYGTRDTYKKLVQRMVSEFGRENGGEYDVRFFPYNWLEDLNDSVRKLEADIMRNGYTDVVFITHSTGGLLASAYISKSNVNKLKVKKALLIAAPLFGTYASLLPIERGDSRKTVNMLSLDFWIDAISDNDWVKGWARNSPTTYQLLPSREYLQYYPVYYTGGVLDSTRTFTDISSLYWLMNNSESVNPKLTNGSDKSHSYFRETVLHDDVVNQWALASLMEVDTVLIGTASGHSTTAYPVYSDVFFSSNKYLSDIVYNNNGDGTVQGISAMGAKLGGTMPLRYDFSYSCDHGGLVEDDGVLRRLCAEIRGLESGAAPSSVLPSVSEEGMSDMLKLRFETSDDFAVTIYDASGEAVATASGDEISGFDHDELILDTFGSEEKTFVSLYMPATGYRAEVTHGSAAGEPVDFTYEASTLTPEGWKDVSVTNSVLATTAGGLLTSLDCTSVTITPDNIAYNVTGSVVRHANDWTLPDGVKLNKGDRIPSAAFGGDAAKADLNWQSADESIAEVSADGGITAKGYGITTVTATDGNKSLVMQVTVMQNVSSLSFDNIDMVLGERTLIRPNFQPASATETNVTYTVDKSGVIEINEYGVIRALAAGKVKVTGTASGGASAYFTVEVTDPTVYSVESISIPAELTIAVGDEANLNVAFTPSNATDRSISWFVEDEEIISLEAGEESARITALAEGETKVTAVSADGGYSAECRVTVAAEVEETPGTPEPSHTPLPTLIPAATDTPEPTLPPPVTEAPATPDPLNWLRGGGSTSGGVYAAIAILIAGVVAGAAAGCIIVAKQDEKQREESGEEKLE